MLNLNFNINIFSNVECPSAQELGDNSRQNYPDSAKFSQTFLFSSVLFELFANPKQKPANSFFVAELYLFFIPTIFYCL